jgi:hypothetical protein
MYRYHLVRVMYLYRYRTYEYTYERHADGRTDGNFIQYLLHTDVGVLPGTGTRQIVQYIPTCGIAGTFLT